MGTTSTLWTNADDLTDERRGASIVFMVQAASGVGNVTIDDNLGAYYRHGSIPGPLGPGESPPTGTTLAFTTGPPEPPASVKFGASFSVTVDLNSSGAGCTVGPGKLIRIGLGGAGLPAITNSNGVATVTLRAALTPGTYPVTASFAGDSSCGSSDVSDTVLVVKQPTTLTLDSSLVATLKATTSPSATPLHQRNVFVIFKRTVGAGAHVFTAKTDPLGVVQVPQSLLTSLPAGTYSIKAYFNGVNRPDVPFQVPPDDVDYGPSESPAVTRELWPFTGFFGLSNPPTLNTGKGGQRDSGEVLAWHQPRPGDLRVRLSEGRDDRLHVPPTDGSTHRR